MCTLQAARAEKPPSGSEDEDEALVPYRQLTDRVMQAVSVLMTQGALPIVAEGTSLTTSGEL